MLDELERILAALYATSERARHVLDRAGIPAANINLDGAMLGVWHGIVTEAINSVQLLALVRVAAEDYPQRTELTRIRDFLQRVVGTFNDSPDDMDFRPERDPERLRKLEQTVARMSDILKGSEWGGKGLIVAVERVEIKVDALTHDVARIIDNQRLHRRVVASLSVICAMLLVAVVALAYVIAQMP